MSSTSAAQAKVSVGMPVYNGETYLRGAIESILSQSFAELELVIADNASTDATEAICAEYAATDERVQYIRHQSNIGAMANFNFVVGCARAPYFMWAAADDRFHASYIGLCAAELDAHPDVVLCSSLVRVIDGNDREIAVYDSGLQEARDENMAQRFAALIMHRHLCTDMFGLMRLVQVRNTELMNSYYGGDRGFLAEMSLLGRFAKIERPLFENREHPRRDSRITTKGRLPPDRRMAIWKLYRHYGRSVQRHVSDAHERRACRRHLVRWWFVDWNLARLLVDCIAIFWTSVYRVVGRMKLYFYGPLPQIGRKK